MKTRVYIGFIAAIIFVLLVGLNSHTTFKKQYAEADKLRQSSRVLNQLQLIQLLLIDMETSRRGYRSTNEKRFLTQYKTALPQVDPSLAELRGLVAEPQIKAKLPALEGAVANIIVFWKSLGENAGNLDKTSVTQLMDKEQGLMDVIRKQIIEITQIEKNILEKTERENAASVKGATEALIISIVLIVVIVLLLIYLILKEFKIRQVAEAKFQKNNEELEIAHNETSEKNWLLEGAAEINNSLHGKTDQRSLSQSILDAIIRYLKISGGGFYIHDKETASLQLMGVNALPANSKTEYKMGEGLVGGAAIQKEIFIVEGASINPVNNDVNQGNAKTGQTLYMPIYSNGELNAVIELITLSSFSPQHKKLLEVICNNIGIALTSAEASKNILKLLKQVQDQKHALVQQQEELRQANEELTQQTEGLQHSEEELKVQEEELRQINAELEDKNEAVETARQALELKAKELELTGKYKSEFLANMSHELRTPLNSVLILAKLLSENKDHNLNEKQVSHAKIIYKSGSDLLQLINDILDLSKIEAGKIDLNFENVMVKGVADDIEQLFHIVAEEKNIHFKINIDENVPESVQTDKQRLEQVLKNLLSNAFKFTEPDGEIDLTFSVALNDKTPLLQMAVSDNGIGISSIRQQGIFEAFQQADGATNRKYGGTGLGLSISKELVRMLGGSILLESEEGKGSIFKVSIPLFKAIVRSDEEKGNEKIGLVQSASSNNSLTIVDDRFDIKAGDKVLLVIEDDDMFAKIVRQFGFSHGFKTMLALNGIEGLQLAKKYKPGAIILDMHLPDMDGGTVLQMIKNDDELKNIPVHIISAREDIEVLPGAFAYLQKPLSKKDLDNVFVLIGEIMKDGVKKVLLISGGNLKDNVLNKLINNRQLDVQCDIAVSVHDAIERIKTVKYDCVIADIGKNVEQGIASLKILSEHLMQQVPVIIYLDEDITPGDDMQLKKISDVVVRNSSSSPERLMDELELFLYKVQQHTNGTAQAGGNNLVLGDQALKGKKALLVDDDMRNIFALSAALETEKMEILTASDGKEALQILSDDREIDIILMDIMMPNMDGYQAMAHIRKDMLLSDVPIIALTAKAMNEDKEKCIAAGASDYISKPVDIQKLKSLMRVWLSQ